MSMVDGGYVCVMVMRRHPIFRIAILMGINFLINSLLNKDLIN